MASDQNKIAALKAIRNKARTEQMRAGRSLMDQYREICSDGNYDDELANGPRAGKEDDFVFREVARPSDSYDEEDMSADDNAEEYDVAYQPVAAAEYGDEEYEAVAPEEDDFAGEDEDYEEAGDDEDAEAAPLKPKPDDDGEGSVPAGWQMEFAEDDLPILNIEFNGKNLENGEFDHEDLENANFSAANLSGVNFSGSNLRGADFSGANLSNTNLSGADLTGAIFSGAQLIGTNFTGALMKNVTLTDVYFQDAILLNIDIDEVTLEDLQELIEYLAKYYPERLNLARINLTMLDLARVDLSKVNLRGVDFTGVDFTGINIMELDLSECIITPQQIAQALGYVPNAIELKKLLAPKKKAAKQGNAIDFSQLFLADGRDYGVYDVSGFKGVGIDKIMKAGSKVLKNIHNEKPPVNDTEALEHIRQEREQQNRANKEELRSVIEERKKRVLAAKQRREMDSDMVIGKSRGGYQR